MTRTALTKNGIPILPPKHDCPKCPKAKACGKDSVVPVKQMKAAKEKPCNT